MDIYLRSNGKVSLALNRKYEKQALDAQQQYTEEDPFIGIIQEWLDTTNHDVVCAAMIWDEALDMSAIKPSPKEVNHIHDIMKNSISGWKAVGKQRIGSKYGVQRAYKRVKEVIDTEKVPF